MMIGTVAVNGCHTCPFYLEAIETHICRANPKGVDIDPARMEYADDYSPIECPLREGFVRVVRDPSLGLYEMREPVYIDGAKYRG